MYGTNFELSKKQMDEKSELRDRDLWEPRTKHKQATRRTREVFLESAVTKKRIDLSPSHQ